MHGMAARDQDRRGVAGDVHRHRSETAVGRWSTTRTQAAMPCAPRRPVRPSPPAGAARPGSCRWVCRTAPAAAHAAANSASTRAPAPAISAVLIAASRVAGVFGREQGGHGVQVHGAGGAVCPACASTARRPSSRANGSAARIRAGPCTSGSTSRRARPAPPCASGTSASAKPEVRQVAPEPVGRLSSLRCGGTTSGVQRAASSCRRRLRVRCASSLPSAGRGRARSCRAATSRVPPRSEKVGAICAVVAQVRSRPSGRRGVGVSPSTSAMASGSICSSECAEVLHQRRLDHRALALASRPLTETDRQRSTVVAASTRPASASARCDGSGCWSQVLQPLVEKNHAGIDALGPDLSLGQF